MVRLLMKTNVLKAHRCVGITSRTGDGAEPLLPVHLRKASSDQRRSAHRYSKSIVRTVMHRVGEQACSFTSQKLCYEWCP
jgi:hypothetical protein